MRAEGFYWVNYLGSWIIAEYYCKEWYITGRESILTDIELDEIDEIQIIRK